MFPKPKRIKDKKLLKSYRDKGCIVCGTIPSEAHHIKTQGSGGNDVETNLLSLCRGHHIIIHQIGPTKFKSKYGIN